MRFHFTFICLLIAGLVSCGRPLFSADVREVIIFQTTDIHGHCGNAKETGLAQIAGNIAKKRLEHPGSTLWIDCGDLTLGTLSATMDCGACMMPALNAAGCDIFVPGNHDFDWGLETLRRNLKAFHGTVLGANLKLDGDFQPQPWTLVQRSGVKIAVIGIVPPYLPLWTAESVLRGVHAGEVEPALARVMPEVMAAKPDVIILAIHLGEFISKRLTGTEQGKSLSGITASYPQINLILAGHSHQTEPGKKLSSGTWMVQAPPLGADAIVCSVKVDLAAKPHKVISITSDVLGTDVHDTRLPEVCTVVNPVLAKADSFGKQKIAEVDVELGPLKNKKQPNALAEMLCKAMCESTGSEAAFSSTVSNYTVSPGILTENHLFKLIPYRNQIITRSLTPAQLLAIYKEQESMTEDSDRMTVSGLSFPNGSQGPVILSRTGKALENGERVTVSFGSHTAAGAGGRCPVLKKILQSATPVSTSPDGNDPDLTEAFRSYLKKHYPILL